MIKNILLDLDGTLLFIDEDKFEENYFRNVVIYFVKRGYDKDLFKKALFNGINGMNKANGDKKVSDYFWEYFNKIWEDGRNIAEPIFNEFYENEFDNLSIYAQESIQSVNLINYLKENKYKLIIATNPLFPLNAIKKRIKWANLDPNDFIFISNYDSCSYSKSNPLFYLEILNKNNLNIDESIMIGNNVIEDYNSTKVNLKCFLLNTHINNLNNEDLSKFLNGDYEELIKYLKNNSK